MENNVMTASLTTRAGHPAVIYFDKASDDYPFLGMYFTEGEWYPQRWSSLGQVIIGRETGMDLQFFTTAPLVA